MKIKLILALILVSLTALPVFAESPYIYGLHFWRDSANTDCMNNHPGWVTELDTSTNYQPDVDKFRRIAEEGHTIIMRVDWGGGNTYPTNPADYWIYAARYAFWVDKLKDYCHIWIIGNEEPALQDCFRVVRNAIHAVQPNAIFCPGDPHGTESMALELGDYIDGYVIHGVKTDWIDSTDANWPSSKTRPIYITEFGGDPPNLYNLLRGKFSEVNYHNSTDPHKIECACRFVYYEFATEYSSLQMEPMQNADYAESALNSYKNSYAQPYIDITNIAVQEIDAASASISWTTDVAASAQVEYWEDGETVQHWSPFYDDNATSHTATINSLTPGRTYHYQVKSYRSGRPLTISDVQTFVHEPPTSGTITGYVKTRSGAPVHKATVTRSPGNISFEADETGKYTISGCAAGNYTLTCTSNVTSSVAKSNISVSAAQTTDCDFTLTSKVNYLLNAGFESDFANWNTYGDTPAMHSGSWFGGITSHGGSKFMGREAWASTLNGGAYQRVTGLPAGSYQFSIFSRMYHGDNPYNETKERVGIDPTGGTDPNSAMIFWSAWDYNFWHWKSAYKRLVTPSLNCNGGNCTVFIQYSDPLATGWHVHAYDDAVLASSLTESQTTSNPAAAKAFEDGVTVILSALIATTDKGALGTDVLYVEDSDRTSGIKVDMTGIATAVSEGNTVTITGAMATDANGERYIDASSVTAGTGTAVGALGFTNGNLGGDSIDYEPGPPVSGQCGVAGGVGANNIGLLARSVGEVKSTGSGYVMITDGSANPLKVDISRTTKTLGIGNFVTVTGIISLEKSGLNTVPVLRARKNGDINP